MKWQDQAIILHSRPYGETSVILDVLTKNYGLYSGLMKGGASKTKKSLLQFGNLVQLKWSARLEEQLGNFSLEVISYYSVNLMCHETLLYAFSILRFHLGLLSERVKHKLLYDLVIILLNYDFKDDDVKAYFFISELVLRFEFVYLSEVGFGIDTNSCAATGVSEDLCYVSPRSAQAVCRSAGKGWQHKLLPLPSFLLSSDHRLDKVEDILASLKLLTYFLNKNIWQNKNMKAPAERNYFFDSIIANIREFEAN